MIITKSKINALKTCPLSFKFKYILKQEPDTKPHYYTNTGLDLHNIFHDFFDSITLDQIPENCYDYFCDRLNVKSEYKMLYNKFCEWESMSYKLSKEHFMPIMREQKVKALDMYGIIDRINFDGHNYSLIDYKSGFYNLSNLRFELCFYKYLVDEAHILDKPIEFIGSYGYNKGEIFFEKVKPRSYKLMLEKVNAFRQIKFKEIEYSKKIGFHCQWCEYRIACSNTEKQLCFSDFIRK